MPDGSATLTLTLHQTIAEIAAAEWDACAGDGQPVRQPRLPERDGGQRLGQRAHRLAAAARGAARRGGRRWWRWRRCTPSRTATANTCSTTAGRMRWSGPAATTIRSSRSPSPFSPAPGPRLLRRPDAGVPVARARRRAGTGVPVARPVLGARHLLHRGGMAARSARPAGCSGSACSSIGRTPATRASTTSSARCRRASARCCGANGATRNAAGLTFHALSGADITERALGRVLPLLSLARWTANGAAPT